MRDLREAVELDGFVLVGLCTHGRVVHVTNILNGAAEDMCGLRIVARFDAEVRAGIDWCDVDGCPDDMHGGAA